jgi:hypothetical protein
MIPLPIALLLLFWHGPSNFERLVQLGVLPEPAAAHRYRASAPLSVTVAAQAIAVRLLPQSSEPVIPDPKPLEAVSASQDALRPAPVLRSQRNRDGPFAA